MSKVLRPIGHEERLSVVDHLDELRSRLIVCLAALIVAFAVCFWQNGALLDVQWTTPHLVSLGAVDVSREHYLELLADAVARLPIATFPDRADG